MLTTGFKSNYIKATNSNKNLETCMNCNLPSRSLFLQMCFSTLPYTVVLLDDYVTKTFKTVHKSNRYYDNIADMHAVNRST